MPTILEHPQAQELLEQATVSPESLEECQDRLTTFLGRYLPLFTRSQQRDHAQTILRGKLSDLRRKTTEPLARHADQNRRPLQQFVGQGGWSDERLRAEMARHVAEEIADPDAVLVLDPCAFPKKGTESCGVARQWCGCLGKVDNCQIGVFLAVVGSRGKALLDARLYLPEDRAEDEIHREKTHVPDEVDFQEKWRIGLDLLEHRGSQVPHGWVTGDDELGRVIALRSQLRFRGERYVLDVPCDTLIRDFSTRREPSRPGGRPRVPLWERVDAWAERQPETGWEPVTIKQGTKGPLEVEVLRQWVQTKDEDAGPGGRELLTVIRTPGSHSQVWYTLSNAREVPAEVIAKVHGSRHGIEELFEEGNQEIGLKHYEVRSWLAWAHHMTLTMLALWFVQLERMQLGGKKFCDDGVASPLDFHRIIKAAAFEYGRNCGKGQRSAATQ